MNYKGTDQIRLAIENEQKSYIQEFTTTQNFRKLKTIRLKIRELKRELFIQEFIKSETIFANAQQF